MATVSLRGKEKVISHYTNTNDPFWKLYTISDKTPLQQYTSGKGIGKDAMVKSTSFLNDILDAIDPSGTYILHTFSATENTEPQRFIKPNTALCFCLSDETIEIQSTGDEKNNSPKERYNSSPASLKDHIELIKENAKLSMECSLYKTRYDESLTKISKLEAEIEELEDILEEYEEDDEDEKGEGVAGTPKTYEEALSKIIVEHAPVILENFMSKGVKDPLKDESMEGSDLDLEEEEEIKINGIPGSSIPEMEFIITELHKKDPNLQRHLYKLMLIAQQKPATFSAFINKLENF